MTKIYFKYDKEKDIYNIWETCNSKAYGLDFSSKMPKNLVEFCQQNDYEKSKDFIKNYFKNIYNSGQLELFSKSIASAWEIIEKEYFRRLQKISKKKLKIKSLVCNITLASRCPYFVDKKEFMISFFANVPTALATIGHETLHFHFHENYFEKVEKEVGKEKAHMIKESMTVLLNLEFIDLWFVPDYGYESHKNLRDFIKEKWKSHKNFNKLVNECIDYIKKDVK